MMFEEVFKCDNRMEIHEAQKMVDFFENDEATIIVVDSGLGGLSVAADIIEGLKVYRAFSRVRVIFFNCVPSARIGYDTMETDEHRCRVFTRALECMVSRFEPDTILLACNTLSVLYERTQFARRAKLPVLGIVEIGTELIADYLNGEPDAQVILFAAATTVRSGVHKKILSQWGFPSEQLIYQRCDGLISAIELGYRSQNTRFLTDRYVNDALKKIPDLSLLIVASLSCTHFRYIEETFWGAFRTQGIEPAAILDPTSRMSEIFLSMAKKDRFSSPEISIQVVTQTPHTLERKQSIGTLISRRSPETAAALKNDTYIPGLFRID
jgi:glutamate racemase